MVQNSAGKTKRNLPARGIVDVDRAVSKRKTGRPLHFVDSGANPDWADRGGA